MFLAWCVCDLLFIMKYVFDVGSFHFVWFDVVVCNFLYLLFNLSIKIFINFQWISNTKKLKLILWNKIHRETKSGEIFYGAIVVFVNYICINFFIIYDISKAAILRSATLIAWFERKLFSPKKFIISLEIRSSWWKIQIDAAYNFLKNLYIKAYVKRYLKTEWKLNETEIFNIF